MMTTCWIGSFTTGTAAGEGTRAGGSGAGRPTATPASAAAMFLNLAIGGGFYAGHMLSTMKHPNIPL